jgi:hypothetical protein
MLKKFCSDTAGRSVQGTLLTNHGRILCRIAWRLKQRLPQKTVRMLATSLDLGMSLVTQSYINDGCETELKCLNKSNLLDHRYARLFLESQIFAARSINRKS